MNPESPARGELARPTAGTGLAPAARIVALPRAGQVRSAQAGAIGPMSLLRALRRRAILALGTALLAAGVAGPAAWYFIPLSYKAHARLQVAALPPKLLFQTVETQAGGGDDYKRFQSTQQTLVKSQLVLGAALRDPKVNQCRMIHEQVDPIEWLQQKLDVDFVAASEVMEIALSGNDPAELACIVNAVKTAYMNEVVDVDARRRMDRHEHLKMLKEKYAAHLKEKRDHMRKLAETVGSNDQSTIALKQQLAMEHLQALRTELLGVQSQKRKWEAQLKAMAPVEADEAEAPPPLTEREIDQLVEQDPDVAELAAELAEAEQTRDSELAKLRRVSRNAMADPAITALNAAVKSAGNRLAQRRRDVRPEVERQGRQPVTVEELAQGQDIKRELAVVVDLEERLKKEIDENSNVNQNLTVKTLDLQGNQEEIAQMQVIADKIGAEVEALNIELQAAPRIRTIDDATAPRTRDDKKRFMMVGVVTFGSFFGSLFGIAFLELQTRKVDTADEVPLELGLTIVGALPILPAPTTARRDRGARDREGPPVAQRPARVGRRDADHAPARGPHRVAPDADDQQRRRRRGEDVAGQLPGDQPGAHRPADAPDRRRPPQPDDAPALRRAPSARAQRAAPGRGGHRRRDGGDGRRGPQRPARGALRPAGPCASCRRAGSPRSSTGSRSGSTSSSSTRRPSCRWPTPR